MSFNRREFLQLLSMGCASGVIQSCSTSKPGNLYQNPIKSDSVRLLHFTDCHAQLEPIYFREPNVNVGLYESKGKPPHVVGDSLLEYYGIKPGSQLAHAFTYLNFDQAAVKYGKVGGFSHLKTLIDSLRGQFGEDKTALMDGGDTWQGSGTSLWTKGDDMVQACNLLGVDVMTGHWEFTYPEKVVRENFKKFKGEFVAQNINVTDDAMFNGAEVFDEDSGHAFKPYTIKKLGNHTVAFIGQAFPYTPIANPKRFVENWTFGIQPENMQKMVDRVRSKHKPDVVVVLSHNGMDF